MNMTTLEGEVPIKKLPKEVTTFHQLFTSYS